MLARPSYGDLQVIAGVPVFRGLKHATIEQIVARATAMSLRPRETVCRQGDLATAFFIVIESCIKIYRLALSGEEAVIRVARHGESFAEAAAFTGSPYLASAEAVGEARVVRIPADHVIGSIQQNPLIALTMIAAASRRIHELLRQIEQLKSQSGIQRVAEFLVSLSPVEHGPSDIALPYGKELIARHLGIRPESLSRAFAKLKSVGVAVSDSHVRVSDVARLHRLASDDRCAIRGTLRIE
jgi:CRP-like cAMP-binding protein